MPWVFNPNAGGRKIPENVQAQVRQRILAHAEKHYAGKYSSLAIRFHGQFCYIDSLQEPPEPSAELLKATGETREQYLERLRQTPTHLVRLRYFGDDRWGVAFFRYSNEKYELSCFPDGEYFGLPEAALDIGAVYLTD